MRGWRPCLQVAVEREDSSYRLHLQIARTSEALTLLHHYADYLRVAALEHR